MISYTNRIAKACELLAGIDNSNGSNLKDLSRIADALEKYGNVPSTITGRKWRKDTERIADAVEYIANNAAGGNTNP